MPINVCCQIEMVKQLLKFGASVNVTDKEGYTPLSKAVANSTSDLEIIKVLLENGADINVKSRSNNNAGSALYNSHYSLQKAKLLVKMFLIQNFEVNSKRVNLDPLRETTLYNELSKYLNDCTCEIIQMKTEVLKNGFLLYDVVTCGSKIALSINDELVKKMKKFSSELYPIYQDVVMDRIQQSVKRGKLMSKLYSLQLWALKFSSEQNDPGKVILDSYSLHKIAEYLSTEDLKIFVSVFDDNSHNFTPETLASEESEKTEEAQDFISKRAKIE